MAIIKQKDIYDDSKKVFDKLNKELIVAEKNTKELTAANKALQKSYRDLKNTNDGAEAKKLDTITKQLTTNTKKLTKAKTVEQRAAEKLVKQNKKLNELYTPQARALALVKEQTLQQTRALKEQAKATLGVKKASNGLISGLKNMGKQLAGGLGLIALTGALVNQFNKANQRSNELIKSTNKLKNTFDLTTSQAKKLAIQINAIANNFEGVDVQNLEVSLAAITGTFKDISESEALNLIQEGFQKGSNNSGEFLDILKEYPVQFKAAGIDAKTMFAIINQQVKQGIYSDKGVDTIKEGGLRLRENTVAVQAALKPLDESIKLQIKQEIAAGNSFKAIQLVSEALKDTSLTAEQTQTIIADVFGGAGEDAGIEYIKTLADIETNLDNVAKQTTINEDANLRLTKGYNAFILSVSEGDGVISRSFANIKDGLSGFLEGIEKINSEKFATKMKVMANGVLSVANAISFGGLNKALKNLTQSEEAWRFNTDKASKALGLQKTEIDKNEKSTRRLTTAEKEEAAQLEKSTKTRKKNTKAVKENRIEKGGRSDVSGLQGTGEIAAFEPPTDEADQELAFQDEQNTKKLKQEKDFQDKIIALDKETKDKQKQLEADWITAKAQLVDAGFAAAEQIASDIFAAGQDAKLARIAEADEQEKAENESKAESEKEILRQQLEQGLITETEFKERSLAIDEDLKKKQAKIDLNFRREQAKADKQKALFDIGIATGVAVIRQLSLMGLPWATPFIGAILGLAGIQTAAVLSRPLPKFGKGEVDIQGLSHDEGGINANIEGHESVINTLGTANAPNALRAINDGLITDEDLGMMQNSNNYNPTILQLNGLSTKFDQVSQNTHQTNQYLKHMYSHYENNGMIHFKDAHGKVSSLNKVDK